MSYRDNKNLWTPSVLKRALRPMPKLTFQWKIMPCHNNKKNLHNKSSNNLTPILKKISSKKKSIKIAHTQIYSNFLFKPSGNSFKIWFLTLTKIKIKLNLKFLNIILKINIKFMQKLLESWSKSSKKQKKLRNKWSNTAWEKLSSLLQTKWKKIVHIIVISTPVWKCTSPEIRLTIIFPFLLSNFCLKIRKNSTEKTMNGSFLKRIFSSETFVDDYK